MFAYFLLLLIVVGIAFIIRPITTLIHELGHAIPALFFTKQKVTIYVGSYGNPDKSLHINLGLIEIWFRYNPFVWQTGLCVPSKTNISINKQILYILAGPLASIFLATMATIYALNFEVHGFLKLALVVFSLSAIFDLLANLIPNKNPIKLFDGSHTFNDGYQLLRLIYFKKMPPKLLEAWRLYDAKKYTEASTALDEVMISGYCDRNLYVLAMSTRLFLKQYERAQIHAIKLLENYKLTSDEYVNVGLVYAHLNLLDRALEYYDNSLKLNSNNKFALNNKGYLLCELGKYEEAIKLLNRAIMLDDNFAYAYSNRGLALIKTGKTDAGLADLERSIELDASNVMWSGKTGHVLKSVQNTLNFTTYETRTQKIYKCIQGRGST